MFSDQYYEKVIAAQFDDQFRRGGVSTYRNIVGYAIGEKTVDGKFTGEPAVIVYVKEKVPTRRLRSTTVPDEILGLPTDVVEVGEFRALESPPSLKACRINPAARMPRPFPAGVSIGGGSNSAGSLGFRVRRGGMSVQLILSNCHVLADLDDPKARPPVFQPGFGDGLKPDRDQIGRLIGVVPLKFDGTANKMDAAVAAIDDDLCIPGICRFGPLDGAEDPVKNEQVKIFGKTTRQATGFIRDMTFDMTITFGNRKARFTEQMLIEVDPQTSGPIAQGGDSGSLVIKAPKTACGLLFAASDNGKLALATPITRVLTRFKIELVV